MKYFLIVLLLAGTALGVLANRARGVEPNAAGARSAAETFARSCASCHGKDGRAKTFKAKLNHARNLTDADWQDKASDERIFNSITNGKGKMPSFAKKLSETEVNALVNYVRGLKK